MKTISFILYLSFSSIISVSAQQGLSGAYLSLTKKADSLYTIKNFKKSALVYSEAFKANNWRATNADRYNAACSWALSGVPDSSFSNLFKIARKGNFSDEDHLQNDPDLSSLHNDNRWNELTDIVKVNKSLLEKNYNQPVKKELEEVFFSDQSYRKNIDSLQNRYGEHSEQFIAVLDSMKQKDALNLQKVKEILNKYGWLGTDEVGIKGNLAFFVVLIHADLETMRIYFPKIQSAVQQNKCSRSNLAYYQDKMEIMADHSQTYGTQLEKDPKTNKFYVLPVKDKTNLDKLRGNMGLPPIESVMKEYNITEIK